MTPSPPPSLAPNGLKLIPNLTETDIFLMMVKCALLQQKGHAENILQIVNRALIGGKENWDEVPSIKSCFDELEAALQGNEFVASSAIAINDRTMALKNTTMHHFKCIHHHYRR